MSSLAAPIHTWTLPRDSRLIRFYLWLYADTLQETYEEKALSKLTFCRLFWGIVASPLVLLVIGLFFAVVGPVALVVEHLKKNSTPKVDNTAARLERRKQQRATRARRATAIAEGVGSFFDRIAAFLQNHPAIAKTFRYVWRIPAWGLVVGLPAAAIAFGVYSAVSHSLGFANGIKFAGIGVGSTIVLTLFVAGVAVAVTKTGTGKLVRRAGGWLFIDVVWDGGATRLGRFLKLVGQFFVAGHHAVKYRTCPMVKVISPDA